MCSAKVVPMCASDAGVGGLCLTVVLNKKQVLLPSRCFITQSMGSEPTWASPLNLPQGRSQAENLCSGLPPCSLVTANSQDLDQKGRGASQGANRAKLSESKVMLPAFLGRDGGVGMVTNRGQRAEEQA